MNSLEAESIEIIREAVATSRNPVMMYSIGKDSSVLLHLARKAFYPAPPPFPLLHVDTGWKFKAMYAHRDRMIAESGARLITRKVPPTLISRQATGDASVSGSPACGSAADEGRANRATAISSSAPVERKAPVRNTQISGETGHRIRGAGARRTR